ncbi:MAG: heme-binding domain-containing protein [Anaerolineae bacterium]
MKRILLIAVGAVIVLAVLIQLVPYGHAHTNPPVQSEPQWDSPQTRALAQRACFDCHSNQTVWPWYSNVAPVSWLVYGDVMEGRRRLNFSEWNRPQGQYIDELKVVCAEKSMPPAKYLLLHPSASLTDAEWQQLCGGFEFLIAHYQR